MVSLLRCSHKAQGKQLLLHTKRTRMVHMMYAKRQSVPAWRHPRHVLLQQLVPARGAAGPVGTYEVHLLGLLISLFITCFHLLTEVSWHFYHLLTSPIQ